MQQIHVMVAHEAETFSAVFADDVLGSAHTEMFAHTVNRCTHLFHLPPHGSLPCASPTPWHPYIS